MVHAVNASAVSVSLASAALAVAGVLGTAGRHHRHRAVRLWAVAFALDALRFAIGAAATSSGLLLVQAVLAVGGGYFLVSGVLQWISRPQGRGWQVAAGLAGLGVAAAVASDADAAIRWGAGVFLAVARARASVALALASCDGAARLPSALGLALLAISAWSEPWEVALSSFQPVWAAVTTVGTVLAGLGLVLLPFGRRQEAAEAAQAQLRSIFEESGQNIAVYADDGTIVRMNPAFAATLPTREPMRIDGSLVPDDGDRAAFFRPSDFSSRPVQRVRIQTRGGGLRDFDISVSRLPHDELFMVFAYDVSKQVALEQELEVARRTEALGRVATGIAHDFNNTLNVINTYAELGTSARQPREDALERILEATRRGERLTQKLLTLGRRQPAMVRQVRIDQQVREATEWLEGILGEGIELRVDVADDPPLRVWADPAEVDQLLFNLVSNAREVMPNGGRIDVRAHEYEASGGPVVRLEVGDEGPGIPSEIRGRIFDPFFSTKETSAGLGLATVRSIVRARDWSLSVHDGSPTGTVFRIDIPMVPEEVSAETLDASADEPVFPLRLLLVDDNAALVEVTARSLRQDGYRATAVTTGFDALEHIREKGCDVLITDYDMPGMDGRELVERAWVIDPDLRIILISGLGNVDWPEDPRVRALPKPTTEHRLRACLREIASPTTDGE